ncbi:MAG TPA: hypothetical protein VGD65_25740 [Chryseosolibacter sp.]
MEFKILTQLRTIGLYVLLFVTSLADAQELPNLVRPSPETAALFRFQDYPMDYSTGLPSINIPLYEVQSGSLRVPISVSYHASGLKVSDEDGPVANGWSLNAGGAVSRTIHGSADFGEFRFPFPFTTSGLTNSASFPYLEKLSHYENNPQDAPRGSWLDSEYDIFSYSFNGNAGKFIFQDNNDVKTPKFFPFRPYVVTPIFTTTGLTSIEIIDDQGITYKFVGNETYSFGSGMAISSYSLSQIVSADKTETINFTYTTFSQTRKAIDQQIIFRDRECDIADQQELQESEFTTTDIYQIARLTEISFSQGKIVFNLLPNSDKIGSIDVKDLAGQVIKKIEFQRSLLANRTDGISPMNKLEAISFQDKNSVGVEKISFEYNPVVLALGQPAGSALNVRYRDWWNYYNASGQHDLVPQHSNLNYQATCFTPVYNDRSVGNPLAKREPDLNALKSGVLKKIIYPTGGFTEFVYENNKYKNGLNNIVNGPGLRVASISSTENIGMPVIKEFKYGVGENGVGFLELEPLLDKMKTEYRNEVMAIYQTPRGYFRERIYYSSFVPQLSELADRPLRYQEVSEYIGTNTNNVGKVVYNYDHIPWGPAGIGPTKWHIYDFNYWNTPSLTKKSDYEFKKTGQTISYTLRSETISNFTATNLEYIPGLHVQRFHNFLQTELMLDGTYPERYAITNENLQVYNFGDYRISYGTKNLMSTIHRLYQTDGSIAETQTSYSYNGKQYVSAVTSQSSKGETLINEKKYPFDFLSVPVYAKMSSASINMLNVVVEETDLRGGANVKSIRTNFYDYGGSKLYPETIEAKVGTGPYETKIRFHQYDGNGNILKVSKESDVSICYLWDYENELPVAEVKNCDSKIAFTSFEDDAWGNWTGVVLANIRTDIRGITGNKYYNLANTPLSVSSLDPAKTYFISYWTTGGTASLSATHLSGWPRKINSVQDTNGVTWECWEHKFKDVTSVTISGTVYLDELRLHSEDAQMTTYTFDPLIGLQSKTDSNNTTQYFEYDDYGRLKLIRDYQRNILKSMSYNSIQK